MVLNHGQEAMIALVEGSPGIISALQNKIHNYSQMKELKTTELLEF